MSVSRPRIRTRDPHTPVQMPDRLPDTVVIVDSGVKLRVSNGWRYPQGSLRAHPGDDLGELKANKRPIWRLHFKSRHSTDLQTCRSEAVFRSG